MQLIRKRCPFCGCTVHTTRPDYEAAMEVINEVAGEHLITPAEMISPSRMSHYVEARNCAAARMRALGFSLKAIGLYLGGRHYSTIIHSLKKVV